MSRETVRLTREELYTLVWSEPMRRLAERFDISDVGLRKICYRMNVPVPGLGYWRRKETGHAIRQTPLPVLPAGVRLEREVTLATRIAATPPAAQSGGTVVGGMAGAAGTERAAQEGAAPPTGAGAASVEIHVAETLAAAAPLHPLVAGTHAALKRAKPGELGLVRPSPPALAVAVTLASTDRALRILDALLKALDALGYQTTTDAPPPDRSRWWPGRSPSPPAPPPPTEPFTRVLIGEHAADAVIVSLTERVRSTTTPAPPPPPPPVTTARRAARPLSVTPPYRPPPPPIVTHHGTGELVLTLVNAPSWLASFQPAGRSRAMRQTWADGSRQRLERVLDSVVAGIVAAGEARCRWRQRLDREEEERRETERRQLEERRRREAEAQHVAQLDRQVAAWQKAQAIRAFTAALRNAAGRHGAFPEGITPEWLDWAEAYAARLDPLAPPLSGPPTNG